MIHLKWGSCNNSIGLGKAGYRFGYMNIMSMMSIEHISDIIKITIQKHQIMKAALLFPWDTLLLPDATLLPRPALLDTEEDPKSEGFC